MVQKAKSAAHLTSKYTTSISTEGFMSYELKIAAQLLSEGLNSEELVDCIAAENLFQYPTKRSIRTKAQAALHLLEALENDTLISAIAEQSSEISKQICLYAMMKRYRLVREFMIGVIGTKYRLKETGFSKADVNMFFIRLQEQDNGAAEWSDSTVTKMEQVLMKTLAQNGYIDNIRSKRLNPVLISPILEKAILVDHDEAALSAFNCFHSSIL